MSNKHKVTRKRVLVDLKGGEYSANPGDYFQMSDDDVFKGLYLAEIIPKDYKFLKENPTKADLTEKRLKKVI